MRALGILLNPIGALLIFVFGPIGRKIDSWFSPAVGMVAGVLVFACAFAMAAMFVWAMHDEMGRAVGLIGPDKVETVQGTITRAETLRQKTLTQRQRIDVSFSVGGVSRTLSETVTGGISERHAAGDVVTVYVSGNKASTEDPNDRVFQILVTVIATAFAAAFLFWGWLYLRYRGRLFVAARAARPQGRDTVLSTADRLKASEDKARRRT